MKIRAIITIIWWVFGPKIKSRAEKIGRRFCEKRNIPWSDELAAEVVKLIKGAVMRGEGVKFTDSQLQAIILRAMSYVKSKEHPID